MHLGYMKQLVKNENTLLYINMTLTTLYAGPTFECNNLSSNDLVKSKPSKYKYYFF